MKRNFLITVFVCVFFISGSVFSQNSGQDESDIRAAAQAYVNAFNTGDAKALAELWAVDAEYITPLGISLKGRDQIREGFESFFQNNREGTLELKDLEVKIENPKAARTTGSARFTGKSESPTETDFVAQYEKRDGKWQLVNVGEADSQSPHYSYLKNLSWLVGSWSNEKEDIKVETFCDWTTNKNFLTMTYTVTVNKEPDAQGTEIIGWDPTEKTIRSWSFDSEGGFGQGVWTKQDGKWFVKTATTLNDGTKASSLNSFAPADNNSFTWSSINRETAGEPLPSINDVKIVRKQ
jgi:uncharacterized protein (TIGR02246 family)